MLPEPDALDALDALESLLAGAREEAARALDRAESLAELRRIALEAAHGLQPAAAPRRPAYAWLGRGRGAPGPPRPCERGPAVIRAPPPEGPARDPHAPSLKEDAMPPRPIGTPRRFVLPPESLAPWPPLAEARAEYLRLLEQHRASTEQLAQLQMRRGRGSRRPPTSGWSAPRRRQGRQAARGPGHAEAPTPPTPPSPPSGAAPRPCARPCWAPSADLVALVETTAVPGERTPSARPRRPAWPSSPR